MLGKTANGLFWMSRYLERAENTARMIEAGQRIGLTRLGNADEEWKSVLQTAGSFDAYSATYETVSKAGVINWLLRDRANPASILACLGAARQNARLVRTAITGEVWEAINAAHLSSQEKLARDVPEKDLAERLRKVRQDTAVVRGMINGTMMRNDIYDFTRIGTLLERADNTARILDVKYYVLLPMAQDVGSSIDNVQWESILRSVSARGGFRMEYEGLAGPSEIVQFLVLNRRMPRSLRFCASKLRSNLEYLSEAHPVPTGALEKVNAMLDGPLSLDVAAIFDHGLHEFLQETLRDLSDIGAEIERDFRFYE